jgi:hypothetical protein
MRRTKLVLAAAAVMVALLVAFAAPAMAHGHNFKHNDNFNRFDDNFRFDNFNRFDDDLEFNNFNRCFNFPFCNDFGDESHGAVSGGTIIINRT